MDNQIKFEPFDLLYQKEKELRMESGMGVYVPGLSINYSDEWVYLTLVDELIGKKIQASTSDGVIVRIDQEDFINGIPKDSDQIEIKNQIIKDINEALFLSPVEKWRLKFLSLRGKRMYNLYKNLLLQQKLDYYFSLVDEEEVSRFREYFESEGSPSTSSKKPKKDLPEQPNRDISERNVLSVSPGKVSPLQKESGISIDVLLIVATVIINLLIICDYLFVYNSFMVSYFKNIVPIAVRREVTPFFVDYGFYIRLVCKVFLLATTFNFKKPLRTIILFISTLVPFLFINELVVHFDLAPAIKSLLYIFLWIVSFF